MPPAEMTNKLLVIGSDAIGCELASFYSGVGAEVTIVEMLDRILPVEDAEVSDFVKKAFEKQGIKVLANTKGTKLDKKADSVVATIDDGKKPVTQEFDRVISAVGVTGKIERFRVEKIGMKTRSARIAIAQAGSPKSP